MNTPHMMNTVRRGSSHDGSWLELDMMMMNDDEVTGGRSMKPGVVDNRKRSAFGVREGRQIICSQLDARYSIDRIERTKCNRRESKAKRPNIRA